MNIKKETKTVITLELTLEEAEALRNAIENGKYSIRSSELKLVEPIENALYTSY